MATRKKSPGRVSPEALQVLRDTAESMEIESQSAALEEFMLLGCAVLRLIRERTGYRLRRNDHATIVEYLATTQDTRQDRVVELMREWVNPGNGVSTFRE